MAYVEEEGRNMNNYSQLTAQQKTRESAGSLRISWHCFCQCQSIRILNLSPRMIHYLFARNKISLNHMNNINRARVASLMLSHYRPHFEGNKGAKEHPQNLVLGFCRSFLLAVENDD